ncbi:MAG: phosphoglucomutase/phosphomannomutase family protein [Aquificaceae bacterium]|jgi:phosphomannomutase|uniref:phosphoglucomutase/phosphomannomutase family protein n=1 Tax=Hydrogenobacter sp. Uz 6-8 TaxID=3384828 RepID=UPI000F1241A3|nr:MAG: phosphoglucomutase/phosphomannomutase family protein [Aquificota bacterium]
MIKFGTDGWRAIIGDSFTFENVRKVAHAHARVLQKQGKKKVVVGYDNRFMSEHFALEVYRVFRALGFECFLTNKACTTPMVSFAVKYMGFDNGVVITASHNPPEYNGYKIKDSFGGSATPEFIAQVEEELKFAEVVKPEKFQPEYVNVWGEYTREVKSRVNMELFSQKDMLLVHDAMYGSALGTYSHVLSGTRIGVHQIRSYRDPLFGGHAPEPVEKHLEPLMLKVKALKAHLGIANDGDGDRIALVDDKGSFVNAQLIYVLLLYHLLRNKGMRNGVVVKTVSTTYLADRICRTEGVELKEVAVGFKNINEVILKERVIFGGEESGGYGIVDFLPERDGLFTGLNILELLMLKDKPLSEVIEEIFKNYGEAHFKRVDFHAEEDKKQKLRELIKNPPERLGNMKVSKVITLDGLKLVFENDGWVLFRASGTEPLIRVYAEMPSKDELEEVLRRAVELFD